MGCVVTQHVSDWRVEECHLVHGRLPFPSSVILFSTAVNVMEPNSCLPGTKQILLVEVKKNLHGICI